METNLREVYDEEGNYPSITGFSLYIISCLWTSLLWSVYPVVCQFPALVFSLDFLPTGGFNPIPFPQALLATSWGSTVKMGHC